jgi:hypothetical protein
MVEDKRDWYSVSVDSLRLGMGLLIAGALGAGGFYGYQRWKETEVERRAFEVVAQSQGLYKQLKTEEGLVRQRQPYEQAAQVLRRAEEALDEGDYRAARGLGGESLSELQGILDRLRFQGQAGIAWFVAVEGDVQYSRGEKGEFVTARTQDVLYEGDYVRTSGNGSAEIYFTFEGARFKLGPGALYQLPRGLGGGEGDGSFGFMEYGWVALNTSSQSESGISTKYSEVTVGRNSQAMVSLPRDSSRSRVAVTRGQAKVRSSRTGEVRQLGELQQVTQTAERIGPTSALPGAPLLLEPPDNLSINIDSTQEVQLAWDEVNGAGSYTLEISRSRLFNDNLLLDSESVHRDTAVKIGLQEEGNYLWRVAATNRNGQQGPWSEYRKFKVASFEGLSLEDDNIAPPLEVNLQMQGNLVVFRGQTEPGAGLEINGESITVDADGSFSSTIEIFGRDGEWVSLVFKARDESGNTTTAPRRVFLPSV